MLDQVVSTRLQLNLVPRRKFWGSGGVADPETAIWAGD